MGGTLAMTMVGATNVGSIALKFDKVRFDITIHIIGAKNEQPKKKLRRGERAKIRRQRCSIEEGRGDGQVQPGLDYRPHLCGQARIEVRGAGWRTRQVWAGDLLAPVNEAAIILS